MSRSIAQFTADLRRVASQQTRNRIAAEAAPVLTALVLKTFNASENAYGNAWSPSVDGKKVTLRGKTEKLAGGLQYVATGARLRLKLAVSYAKYQVGKRPVAPTQGGVLPVEYSRALERTAVQVCKEAFR